MRTKETMLEAALEYAKRGWKGFPLEEFEKAPRLSVRDGGRGVHDATTDTKQIETWITRFPNCNWGIHTEKFFVLDVDSKTNGHASLEGLERTYNKLPETLTQNTPSGGKHYLFLAPKGILIKNKSGFYPGLDVRSQGGYIAVAPSETLQGFYTWDNNLPIADAPEWLINLVKDNKEGYKQALRSDTGSRDIDDASMAGFLLNSGMDEDQIFNALQFRNNNPKYRDVPLPSNEIWKTVRSIAKREVNTPAALRQAIHDNQVRVKQEKSDHLPDVLWKERCIKDMKDGIKNVLANAESCLLNDPFFCNTLAFNELSGEVKLMRNIVDPLTSKVIGKLQAGVTVDEHITREMLILCQRMVTPVFAEQIFGDAIGVVARSNAYNPLKDYLHSLVWDGQERINTWLIDHFGVEDDKEGYTRGIGRRWLVSAVSRALTPGCKADCMLVLEGEQGIGKSPALGVLANGWFKDSPIDFKNKDRFSALKNTWIYELAEFDQYKGSDAASVKSFMSSTSDTYRPAYGRSDIAQPRSVIFCGTTNKDEYLVDSTGSKRFWPMKCSGRSKENPIDLSRLEAERDQIWAESVRAFYTGEPGFIDLPELMKAHSNVTLQRQVSDTWEDIVLHFMASVGNKKPVTTGDILQEALRIETTKQDFSHQRRLNDILERHGYERKSAKVQGKVVKAWRRQTDQKLLGFSGPR